MSMDPWIQPASSWLWEIMHTIFVLQPFQMTPSQSRKCATIHKIQGGMQ
jgi:hypothetical protein